MSTRTLSLDDDLYQYLVNHSVRDTPVQRDLRLFNRSHPRSNMQTSPEQGQFMSLLVKLTGARKIVEIGTFTGYSALCMAQALPRDGQLICCDINEEWTGIAQSYWEKAGVRERIDLRIAPALETLESLMATGHRRQFDMAFIDADKTNYLKYYDACLQLLRPGGLIMFDNTLWNGAVADPAVQDPDTVALRELNRALLADQRVDISLVPIGDGLTLARKR